MDNMELKNMGKADLISALYKEIYNAACLNNAPFDPSEYIEAAIYGTIRYIEEGHTVEEAHAHFKV